MKIKCIGSYAWHIVFKLFGRLRFAIGITMDNRFTYLIGLEFIPQREIALHLGIIYIGFFMATGRENGKKVCK